MKRYGLAVLAAIWGWSGCTECRNEGATWCEGTRIMSCSTKSNGHAGLPLPSGNDLEPGEDCARRGMACFEANGSAGCGIADQQCDVSRAAYCTGDDLMSCHASGHPRLTRSCGAPDASVREYCVQYDAGAVCSLSPDACTVGSLRCFGEVFAICRAGVWSAVSNSCVADGGVFVLPPPT